MPTHIGIGFSQKLNTLQAVKEAVIEARSQLSQPDVDLCLVFNTIQYNGQEIYEHLKDTLGFIKIVGCSSAGIILSDFCSSRGIGICLIRSDDWQFGVGSLNGLADKNPREAGSAFARQVVEQFKSPQRHAFMFFTDGLYSNTSIFLKGIQEVLGTSFPIVGAGSTDDFHFKNAYQISHQNVMSDSAVGLLIGKHAEVGLGNRHGWKPLGKPRTIDSVEHNVIKTIDGKKAYSIYEDFFGNEAYSLRSTRLGQIAILYPLGIYLEEERDYLLRNVAAVLADGSIVCHGEIPLGAEVHLMIGNQDFCHQAAMDAALAAKDTLQNKEPKLIFIFESMARLKLLGRSVFKEIRGIQEILGYNAPIFGMYGNGEIAPFHSLNNIRKTYVHNESITILALA